MPYASRSQQRLFHAKEERGEISPKVVHEFDEATKHKKGGFKKLPEKKMAKGGCVFCDEEHEDGHPHKEIMRRLEEGGESENDRANQRDEEDYADAAHFAHGGEMDGMEPHPECAHKSHGGYSSDHHPECMAHGGKMPKLGSGKRFAAIEKKAAASGAKNPAAVAAAAGIKAHGVKQMEKYAQHGKAMAKKAKGGMSEDDGCPMCGAMDHEDGHPHHEVMKKYMR